MKFYCNRLLCNIEEDQCIKQQNIIKHKFSIREVYSDYCGNCLSCEQGKEVINKFEKNKITKNSEGKICKKCNIFLPYSSFRSDLSCKDGYRNTCKKCSSGK